MKKEILAIVAGISTLVVAAPASAVTQGAICAAAAAATSGTTVSTGLFVKVDFVPKCSANVHLQFDQNATSVGVVSGSSKGKSVFTGSSNGGSVVPTGTCASGCTASDVTLTKATSAASS